jgi:hypothetical protein
MPWVEVLISLMKWQEWTNLEANRIERMKKSRRSTPQKKEPQGSLPETKRWSLFGG